jgi:hypothetical protein
MSFYGSLLCTTLSLLLAELLIGSSYFIRTALRNVEIAKATQSKEGGGGGGVVATQSNSLAQAATPPKARSRSDSAFAQSKERQLGSVPKVSSDFLAQAGATYAVEGMLILQHACVVLRVERMRIHSYIIHSYTHTSYHTLQSTRPCTSSSSPSP